jgi:hypothetical protein
LSLTPTSRIYRVLREVAVLDYAAPVSTIAERVSLTDAQIRRIARRLSSPHWDPWAASDTTGRRGHPWLTFNRHRDTVDITKDGRRALANARSNPHLPVKTTQWKDEALTGMRADGDPTNIDQPVLSSTAITKGGSGDPEGQSLKAILIRVYGALPEWASKMEKREVMWCESCHKRGHWPLHLPREFRKIKGGGRRHECKECEAEARAERRATT